MYIGSNHQQVLVKYDSPEKILQAKFWLKPHKKYNKKFRSLYSL